MKHAIKFVGAVGRWLLPPLVVVLCFLQAKKWIDHRAEVPRREVSSAVPIVDVIEVTRGPVELSIASQGTVRPAREVGLSAELEGRLDSVSKDLVVGGFVRKGQVLVELEQERYRLAVETAKSEVEGAKLALAREEAEAAEALSAWAEVGKGEAPPLVRREPQLAQAEAALAAAEARQDLAELDLERTRILAPFDARVVTEGVEEGAYVQRGAPLCTLHGVARVEIELRISDAHLGLLDLDLAEGMGGKQGAKTLPRVSLEAEFGGRPEQWEGRVVRTGASLDPTSQRVTLIAQVEDPYGLRSEDGTSPLPVGLFVQARIHGRKLDGIAVLPHGAFFDGDHVLVVDAEERLEKRELTVLHRDRDHAYVARGVQRGELLLRSVGPLLVEGQRVAPQLSPGSTDGEKSTDESGDSPSGNIPGTEPADGSTADPEGPR